MKKTLDKYKRTLILMTHKIYFTVVGDFLEVVLLKEQQ